MFKFTKAKTAAYTDGSEAKDTSERSGKQEAEGQPTLGKGAQLEGEGEKQRGGRREKGGGGREKKEREAGRKRPMT